jgi:thymidylate synthase
MNNLDIQYQTLLQDILDNGTQKGDRTGTGTISVFGRQIRHKMSEGFPLLTTKKMAWKSIVTELLWFLRGDTNIKYLVDNDCHIWDGDAYKAYTNKLLTHHKGVQPNSKEAFILKIKYEDGYAKENGELGPIYGKQWRDWNGIDQIQNLINELKTNPDSRRLMVSAWNVDELHQMTLPPCHYGFQVYTRELDWKERVEIARNILDKEIFSEYGNLSPFTTPIITYWLNQYNIPKRTISLMWNQRSVDTFLGLPFNIASYGLLLEMIADEMGMIADELIGNLGDVHLYSNHIEQAKEQINRIPYELPTIHVRDGVESFMPNDIILENYQYHPTIKAPLSN